MREILFRNMTSEDFKKRYLKIIENLSKNGLSTHTERRCFYYVKSAIDIKCVNDLDRLEELKDGQQNNRKRNFHIMRIKDIHTGFEKLICKVCGNIYVIIGNRMYCIGFMHSFKIDFEAQTVK